MNLNASLSLQFLFQFAGSPTPYSNDANIVVSNPPAISNRTPPPVQPVTLPEGYIAYPEIGAAYKIIFNEVTWSEAREQCNLEGVHLAILDSKRKLEYVWSTIYFTHHRTGQIEMYTGIHRMDEKWVDSSTGTTLPDLHWREGYPHDDWPTHNCAIAEFLEAGGSYLQNWVDCSHKRFYLCEVSIPEDYKTQENQMAQILDI